LQLYNYFKTKMRQLKPHLCFSTLQLYHQ